MNILNKVTDDLACEIAYLVTGIKNEHEVIDRIYGIDVGIMGRRNEVHTVDFRQQNETTIIYHIDRNSDPIYRKVNSKKLIRKKLRELNITNVEFNKL